LNLSKCSFPHWLSIDTGTLAAANIFDMDICIWAVQLCNERDNGHDAKSLAIENERAKIVIQVRVNVAKIDPIFEVVL
jgi:hypothetical protein